MPSNSVAPPTHDVCTLLLVFVVCVSAAPSAHHAPAFWARGVDALHNFHLKHRQWQTKSSQTRDCPTFQCFARVTRDLASPASFELPCGIPSCTRHAHHPVTLMNSSRPVNGLVGSTRPLLEWNTTSDHKKDLVSSG